VPPQLRLARPPEPPYQPWIRPASATRVRKSEPAIKPRQLNLLDRHDNPPRALLLAATGSPALALLLLFPAAGRPASINGTGERASNAVALNPASGRAMP